ncbi:FadR/GntR family transcriptional regulator [Asanoa sp. NPDC050611]|uniref:FadR/GntR family transcriptional regulator n=1 Tax=Asanoa sp. NPDC050611 TaxID=3157098 RepID=UPI0033C322FA
MNTRVSAAAPAYQELADRLREQVLAGTFAPGDRLPTEPELCALYGVSRSTVREALRVLSSQHLVTTVRGVAGGTFVVRPEPHQISSYLQASFSLLTASRSGSVGDLLEVRDMLEVPAAGLAARRRTADDLEVLRQSLFDPRTVDAEHVFEANRNFHVCLLRAAGNPMLEAVTHPMFGVLNERFLRVQASRRFWFRVDRDHREILAAVADGDADGAREAQHAHLQHLRSTYTRIDRQRRAAT